MVTALYFGPPANARTTTANGVADWLATVLRETDDALARVDSDRRELAERGAVTSVAVRMAGLGYPVWADEKGTQVSACGITLRSPVPFNLEVFRAWPDYARREAELSDTIEF